jgi:hypothetical protein
MEPNDTEEQWGRWGDERDNWNQLTEAMAGLCRWITEELQAVPPIGHQLFVSRTRAKDKWSPQRVPLTKVAWREFRTANEGRLPKDIAAWETWDEFPDGIACSRYFGVGSPEDVAIVQGALTEGNKIIRRYRGCNFPVHCEWNIPSTWRKDTLPKHYRWIELVSQEKGKRWIDNGVSGLEEAGLDVLAIDDLTADVLEALYDCIDVPDYDDAPMPWPSVQPPPTDDSAVSQRARLHTEHHVFKSFGQVWLLRYPGDKDCFLGDYYGLHYYASLLGRQNKPMDAFEVEHPDDERVMVSFGNDPAMDSKTIHAIREQNEDLEQQIEFEETNSGDPEKIKELSRRLEQNEEYLKRNSAQRGRVRPLGSPEELEQARKRVGIYLLRTRKEIGKEMPLLAEYLRTSITPVPRQSKWLYHPSEDLPWIL